MCTHRERQTNYQERDPRPIGRWLLFLTMLALLIPIPTVAQQIDPNWSPPRTVYIPETGQMIDGVFLDKWRAAGGANAYGYPITAEFEENGRIVQYYQYARFEYVPDDPNGDVVHLGAIGRELRPRVMVRAAHALIGSSAPAAVAEVARIARAWLPLSERAATRENTDAWRYVSETGHSVANGFKAFWEETGEAAYLGNPLTEEYLVDDITYQVFERGQLAWKPDANPWMVPVGEILAKQYRLSTTPVGQDDIPTYSEELFIPPVITPSAGPPPPSGYDKAIVISLNQQSLWAYEGTTLVLSTLVSTGRPGFDTPTGLFFINSKLPIQDMEGVLGGEYYNVPNVPDVMYFTDVGHAIHGAYWHNNFGQVMSHGCINLPLGTSTWLYEWTPIGTPVLIVE